MRFTLRNIWRLTDRAIFKSKGTPYRLTLKRIGWLLFFYTIFPLHELINWTCFLIDDVLFPGYRDVEIEEPVFIIGNPRSGTTFLHRLLAKDEDNFSYMRLWEMLLAPSIVQRKFWMAMSTLDRRLGHPVHKIVAMWERVWHRENVMHRIALNAPEEDELLLLHVWVTLMIWLYSGILEEAERYTYFDSAVSDEEKEYIMGFYKKCLQRHIYTRGTQDKHYLSKNPAFTPKIDALYEFFPDAKIIYLVRNPLNSIPSYISLMDFTWRVMGDPQEEYASREYVLDMAKHWYEYPIDRLEEAPEESYAVVNFHDMVSNPRDIATALYEHFELPLSEAYDETLIVETEKARNYTSQHNYSLDELGLTREQILAEFEDVFELFGFDPQGPVDWASATADGHHAKDMSEKKHRKKKRRLRRSKLGLSVLG